MADPAITPGPQTSEGKIAIVTVVLGILGTITPALLEMFTSLKDAYPNSAVLATVASVVGMLVTLLTALGYIKARSSLKETVIENSAAAQAAKVP
jgi:uncharacterized membrane protein YeaQ/YmgE (transglycosylase-associated protein family)